MSSLKNTPHEPCNFILYISLVHNMQWAVDDVFEFTANCLPHTNNTLPPLVDWASVSGLKTNLSLPISVLSKHPVGLLDPTAT
jgi:hypothetical protein